MSVKFSVYFTVLKSMPNTRNRAKGTQPATKGVCFMCNTSQTTGGSPCEDCNKILKTICANKNDEIDKALASAIKIGRTQNRRA